MSMNPTRREVYEQEILRCLLLKMYIVDIAAQVKLDQGTVRKYIREPRFQVMLKEKYPEIYRNVDKQLSEQLDTISAQLEENSWKALRRIAALMDSGNDHIALKASQDALDRYQETSKVQKVETEQHVKIDPVLLMHAAATAQEVDEYKKSLEVKPKLLEMPPPKELVN